MTTTTPDAPAVYQQIPLDQIVPSPYQTRRMFDEQALQDLAQTLKEHGLMNPINVRPAGGRFELIAGERRWRAARLAGWESITARVEAINDQEAAERVLVENVQREELTPIERGLGYNKLADMGLGQKDIAARVGTSQQVVQQYLSLNDLPPAILEDTTRVVNLGLKHFIEVLRLKSPVDELKLAEEASKNELSVKELRKRVDHLLVDKTKKAGRKTPGAVIRDEGFQFNAVADRIRFSGSFSRTADLDGELTRLQGALLLWVSQHPFNGNAEGREQSAEQEGAGAAIGEAHSPMNVVPPADVQASLDHPRLPMTDAEKAELDALAAKGPAAVYAWIYGPESEYARMKDLTWQMLRIDPAQAIEKTLEGVRMLKN